MSAFSFGLNSFVFPKGTYEKKKIPSIDAPAISKPLKEEFEKFLEYAPARRLSCNLRNLLLWYLIHAEGEYFFNMDDLLCDLTYLFDLLDTAEKEFPINK